MTEVFTWDLLCSGSWQFGGNQGTDSLAFIVAAMALCRTTDLPEMRDDTFRTLT